MTAQGGAPAEEPKKQEPAPEQPGDVGGEEDAPAKRIQDAGSDMLANAASPRRAAETNENLRAARAVFTHGGVGFGAETTVNGDAVGGNKFVFEQHVHGSSKTVTMFRVGQRLLDLARDGYAEAAAFADVKRSVADRRLVILQAPRGYGKTATALHLMAGRGIIEVIGYQPTVKIKEIADTAAAGTGYLVEAMAAATAGSLTAAELVDLDSRLAGAATVVITVTSEVTFVDPGVHRYVVPLGPPPPARDMLRAQLTHLLGAAECARAVGQADVMVLFDEEVPAESSCDRIAQFAWHLHDLWRQGTPDLASLRARLKRMVDREVEGWFVSLPSTQTKPLAISLALLDGLPYETVSATAESLSRRLDPNQAAAPTRTDKFAQSRTARISAIRASVRRAEVPTRLGNLPSEVVQYLDPAYPSLVLSLVWREYDDIRDDLLAWLRDLGNHPDGAVRVRAAAAVGLLSRGSFHHIQKVVVRPWAASKTATRREMAAYALQDPGTEPDLQQQVLNLVNEWLSPDASWQLHAAAARVFGSALGTVLPEYALDRLNRLADTDNADVGLAIAFSLAELIDFDRALTGKVLDRVLAWMGNGNGPRGPVGELAFLTIAGDLVGPARAAGVPSDADWPLLLAMSVNDRRLRSTVAAAWHQTLNGRLFARYARSIAGLWAVRAEDDETAREAMALLFATTAAGSVRTTKIVAATVRTWLSRQGESYAPLTATAVLRALAEPPTRRP